AGGPACGNFRGIGSGRRDGAASAACAKAIEGFASPDNWLMSATTTSPRSASQLEAVVMVTPAAASKSQSGSPAAAQDDLPRSTLSESAAAPGVQSLRKKDGDNSGQKDTVKGPCTAYRRDRRAEIPQLAELHDVRGHE